MWQAHLLIRAALGHLSRPRLWHPGLQDINIRSVIMTIRDIKNKGISKSNKAIYWYVDKCNGDRVYTCFSHEVSIRKEATKGLEEHCQAEKHPKGIERIKGSTYVTGLLVFLRG